MMGCLPFWVDDRPLTNFDNAVTGLEAGLLSCKDKFDMSPLVAVVVNVVRNLTQKKALRLQNSIGLLNEWREGV
jgi:hypothetical protein